MIHYRFFHIVYFDTFAPNVQPEMWQISNLQKVRDVMQEGGFFVTYCAKGQLKRDLQTLGFLVEKLPKPPHKREMTQSILQNNK